MADGVLMDWLDRLRTAAMQEGLHRGRGDLAGADRYGREADEWERVINDYASKARDQ